MNILLKEAAMPACVCARQESTCYESPMSFERYDCGRRSEEGPSRSVKQPGAAAGGAVEDGIIEL
jgi:hypothetical protein